ncbi:MAG: hypothetical protein OQK24_12290 [Magnetovibrio sp.]|nr:hypothetical protein [Magnetovibrio sp.]
MSSRSRNKGILSKGDFAKGLGKSAKEGAKEAAKQTASELAAYDKGHAQGWDEHHETSDRYDRLDHMAHAGTLKENLVELNAPQSLIEQVMPQNPYDLSQYEFASALVQTSLGPFETVEEVGAYLSGAGFSRESQIGGMAYFETAQKTGNQELATVAAVNAVNPKQPSVHDYTLSFGEFYGIDLDDLNLDVEENPSYQTAEERRGARHGNRAAPAISKTDYLADYSYPADAFLATEKDRSVGSPYYAGPSHEVSPQEFMTPAQRAELQALTSKQREVNRQAIYDEAKAREQAAKARTRANEFVSAQEAVNKNRSRDMLNLPAVSPFDVSKASNTSATNTKAQDTMFDFNDEAIRGAVSRAEPEISLNMGYLGSGLSLASKTSDKASNTNVATNPHGPTVTDWATVQNNIDREQAQRSQQHQAAQMARAASVKASAPKAQNTPFDLMAAQPKAEKLGESAKAQAKNGLNAAPSQNPDLVGNSEAAQAQVQVQAKIDARVAQKAQAAATQIAMGTGTGRSTGYNDYQDLATALSKSGNHGEVGVSDLTDYGTIRGSEQSKSLAEQDKDFNDGSDSSSEGSVICTELHRQGLLADDVYRADQIFGARMKVEDPDVVVGYHLWGKPLAKGMRRSKILTTLVYKGFAQAWADEMSAREGLNGIGTVRGKLCMIAGIPACRMLGRAVRFWKGHFTQVV